MRIAIVSPWAVRATSVGGTERYIIDLAEGLVRHGHVVTVWMLSGVDADTNGVAYRSFDINGDGTTATEYDLRRALGDFSKEQSFDDLAAFVESKLPAHNFDVCHINSLLFLKAWPQAKRIFTIHTNPYEYQLDWGKPGYELVTKLLTSEASRPHTRCTVPSRHYAELFSQLTGVTMTSIPHAIEPSRLQSPLTASVLRQKYNLHPDKRIVLLPSRLELDQKRPQIAVAALTELPADDIAQLQVVSTGIDDQYAESRHTLQALADAANLEIHFIRFDGMADAYAMADYVGLPSQSESFGYSALESLTLCKPTIVNRIPTFEEIADGNPYAHLFDGDIASFRSVFIGLLHGDGDTMPQSVPATWAQRYDMEAWIGQYQTMIDQL